MVLFRLHMHLAPCCFVFCCFLLRIVIRFFMKLFRTGDINIVRECQIMFQFQLPSELLEKRTEKFIHDYDKFAAPLIYSDAHCG